MENQNQQEKVSVLIGAYNVENFLKKGLWCLLNQTYKNIEVVLVDDGSTDSTGALCDQLAEKDNRIIVIHKVNEGLGSARNVGLATANGKYICFYDVDDEVELDLIERNVKLMLAKSVDMIIFGIHIHFDKSDLLDKVSFKEHLIESNNKLKELYVDELLLIPYGNGFACNKFYLRSFIEKNKFRFENQRIQQDEVFNMKFYPKLERVYISSDILYHYYIYSNGNARSYFIKDRFEIYVSIFDNFISLYNSWGLNDDRMVDYIYNRFYNGITNTILFNSFHNDAPYTFVLRGKEIRRILSHNKTEKCLKFLEKNNNFSLEKKINLFLFKTKSYLGIIFFRFFYIILRKTYRCLK